MEKSFLTKLKKSTVGLSLIFPIARDFSQLVILFMSANDDMMQMKMAFWPTKKDENFVSL